MSWCLSLFSAGQHDNSVRVVALDRRVEGFLRVRIIGGKF